VKRQAVAVAPELEYMMESLRLRFGPAWKWSEIAEWIVARAQADDGLQVWFLQWARDYIETRRRSELWS
jgi:hypothetical protein